MDQPSPESPPTKLTSVYLKALATWGVVAGAALWTTFFFGFLVASALFPDAVTESWLLQMIREHPSGTFGLAIAAISAFCVVAVLDVLARDPIEIKFFGFELKGAAGPVLLWVICFLAVVAGIDALWDNQGLKLQSDEPAASASK